MGEEFQQEAGGEASGAVPTVQDRPRQALSGLRTFQPSEHPGPHLVRIGPGSQGTAPGGWPGRSTEASSVLSSWRQGRLVRVHVLYAHPSPWLVWVQNQLPRLPGLHLTTRAHHTRRPARGWEHTLSVFFPLVLVLFPAWVTRSCSHSPTRGRPALFSVTDFSNNGISY